MTNFFQNNRQKVYNLLKDNVMAIIHSGYEQFKTADALYPFVVNNNFYYLTGLDQADITLIIAKLNGRYEEWLFIEEHDEVLSKWVGNKLSVEEASKRSGVKPTNIYFNNRFDGFMMNYLQPLRHSFDVIEAVYLDLEQRHLPLYQTFALRYAKELRKNYPAITIENIYSTIVALRMIKETPEIDLIKASIKTTDKALLNILKHLPALKTEAEVEAHHDFILISENKRPSFDNIVASGKNATILHYVKNNQALEPNSLVLLDVGCYTEHYASDITRTYPVNGSFSPRQKEVYEVVLDVNKKCIEYVKAGVTWQELNEYAKDLLTEGCIKLGLIKEKSELGRYYYHSIGHSLGLDVHDPNIARLGLLDGMVITIEPGLYIEEENIGVRIEDDILVCENGHINLSKDIIKEVKDIENFLKR